MPTLGVVSSSDGDTTSRLSDALDEALDNTTPTLPPREPSAPTDVWDERSQRDDDERSLPVTEEVPRTGETDRSEENSLPSEPDAPYVLPEIVPATPDEDEEATPPAPAVAAVPSSVATSPTPPTTGWADHMHTPAPGTGAGLRTLGRRPRVRRVTRVLRHIDPWSTFKVALLFSAVAYVVFLTAGVLLWRVADSTGTLDNVERWFTQFGWETFEFDGGEIFHDAWIIGLFGVVASTGGLVLLVTLFNLVSDIIGGVRMTVLEEEVVERTVSSTRRYVVRHPGATVDPTRLQDWDVDGDEPVDTSEPPVEEWSVDDDAPSADWSVDDEPADGSAGGDPVS